MWNKRLLANRRLRATLLGEEPSDFLLEAGDINLAPPPGINPAITADKETDRQTKDATVTLGKSGVTDRDRVIHFELLIERADGLRLIIQRDPDDSEAAAPVFVLQVH